MMFLRSALVLLALALPARAEIAIQEVTSPAGIAAWLIEDHSIPFVALEIRFRGGTSLDLPGKRGAVNLMTALVEEGAADLDAQGFAAARDALAAEFRFRADEDAVGVSVRMLTENREAATELLRSALVTPRFDADSVERVRGQVLAGLRSDEKDPAELAGILMRQMWFGDHPYATRGDGTLDSVMALSRDDILAAHAGVLARDRIYVAAAGDITATDLGLLLDRLLGDLPAMGLPAPGPAPLNLTAGVTVQVFPGPQSVVLFGQGGIKRDDPDFIAASMLNEILGGGRFTARLMSEVREKRGLTYGVGTGLVGYDHAETMIGQMRVANDRVAEAISVVQSEWDRIATEGVSPEELEATRTYLTGSYPLRFDGNGQIANILVGMQMVGLPSDYPQIRTALIEAVTVEDMARVANRLIQPGQLHFFVVGEPVGVTSTD